MECMPSYSKTKYLTHILNLVASCKRSYFGLRVNKCNNFNIFVPDLYIEPIVPFTMPYFYVKTVLLVKMNQKFWKILKMILKET